MRKTVLTAILALAVGLLSITFDHTVQAADWGLTVDTPLSYTFDSKNASTSTSTNSPGVWNHRSTSDVSGSSVLLITPIHIGFGYEDFSARNAFTFSSTGSAQLNTNFRIYDLAVDVPMKRLNLTFGYGQGRADSDFVNITGAGPGGIPPIRNANVTQTFVLAGIPLGAAFDIHLGYHWVSVEAKDISTNSPPNPQTKLNGEMLTVGLRANF